MPGVPSGRGCEGCRLQKKKCDLAKPSCSRCTRLKIFCVGGGEQRYIFIDRQCARKSTTKGQQAKKAKDHNRIDVVQPILVTPRDDMTTVINGFIELVKPSTDLRYNIALSYGLFLLEVPRRLGTNEAMDAAAISLISAHSQFCANQLPSTDSLAKYSTALSQLRFCLDDPVKACSSETLAAVMLLLMSQSFLGLQKRGWTGHTEGAIQILRARKYYNRNDSFESQLLLTLRGPLLFEGIFNPKIEITMNEWETLIKNHLDEGVLDGQMMLCLARLPGFTNRWKKVYTSTEDYSQLLDDMRANYQALKNVLEGMQVRQALFEANLATKSIKNSYAPYGPALLRRVYSVCLCIGIVLGCVLSAVDVGNTQVDSDLEGFAAEILAHAEEVRGDRPLGTSHMPLCLGAAWMATTDPTIRFLVECNLADYGRDYSRGDEAMISTIELERMSKQLRQLKI